VKKSTKFEPIAVYDAMSLLRPLWLAVEKLGEVVNIIVSDTTRMDLFTRMALAGQIAPPLHKTRLVISEEDPLKVAERLRAHALKWGATPEAIRLLGLVCPLDEEEVREMAKLARKDELKEAAKETPVGGRKSAKAAAAPKNNGNGERLREAAEGKRAAFAAQKITVLVKPADTTLRGGRLAKLEFVAKAKPKTVGDVLGETFDLDGKEIVIDAGALRGMEKREHIEIG
jgi:hypothetical protein